MKDYEHALKAYEEYDPSAVPHAARSTIGAGGVREPSSMTEALSIPIWREAVTKEAKSMLDTKTFEHVPDDFKCSKDDEILGVTWAYKAKYNSDGTFERAKARMCARGDLQDDTKCGETSSPTAKLTTALSLLALAAASKKRVSKLDVTSAYLHAPLPDTTNIYIRTQRDVPYLGGKLWRVRRSLYGLKQAGFLWNRLMHKTLTDIGFSQKKFVDHCLYTRDDVSLCTHVDDMLIIRNEESPTFDLLVRTFRERFGCTYEDNPHTYLSLRLTYTKDGIHLSIPKYIEKIASRWNISLSSKRTDPYPVFAETAFDDRNEQEERVDTHLMQTILGDLTYASYIARPDISVPLKRLHSHVVNASPRHVSACLSIIRYLISTRNYGRLFRWGNKNFETFADADWGKSAGRSTSGVIVMVAGAPIVASSEVQDTTALSTGAAEMIALSDGARASIEILQTLRAIDFPGLTTVPIVLNDNTSTVIAATRYDWNGRFRYLGIRHRFVLDAVEKNYVRVQQVRTDQQAADIMTKIIKDRRTFHRLLSLIGITDNQPDVQ